MSVHSLASSVIFHSFIGLSLVSSHAHLCVTLFIHSTPMRVLTSTRPSFHCAFGRPAPHTVTRGFFLQPFFPWFIHSLTPDSAHSFIALFMHLFHDSLVHSFTQQFMCSTHRLTKFTTLLLYSMYWMSLPPPSPQHIHGISVERALLLLLLS